MVAAGRGDSQSSVQTEPQNALHITLKTRDKVCRVSVRAQTASSLGGGCSGIWRNPFGFLLRLACKGELANCKWEIPTKIVEGFESRGVVEVRMVCVCVCVSKDISTGQD